jgi:hypothetical protein
MAGVLVFLRLSVTDALFFPMIDGGSRPPVLIGYYTASQQRAQMNGNTRTEPENQTD